MSDIRTLPQPFPLEGAIFDFDGTLASTAGLWHQVDKVFLGRRGHRLTPDYSERLAALGFAEGAVYTKERFGLSDTVEAICTEWTELSKDLYKSEVRLRPGAERYILDLRRRGIPCALATTNGADVIESMQNVDVAALFDARVYAEEVGLGKDHPDIYLEAAARLGVAAGRCLVFEDIVPAAHSARAAGAKVCGVSAHDPVQQVAQLKACTDYWLEEWDSL